MKGYQSKTTIESSKPPVQRHVMVPEQFTSCQLHQVIQGVFGRRGHHLHRFEFKESRLLIRGTWEGDDLVEFRSYDVLEEGTQIRTLIAENPRFIYTCNPGDTWGHQILMEKEVEYEYGYPQVLEHKGDNIPEGYGGISSYYDLSDRLDDPETEGHDLVEGWICQQGMGEYDLDEVDANLKAYPVFGQGRAENGREDTIRELTVQKHATGKQKTGIQGVGKPETQKPTLGVVHTLKELLLRFDKAELLRIVKVHRIGGCDKLGENKLTPVLIAALLDSQRMGRFFGTLSGETTAELKKTAVAGDIGYRGDLETLSPLHYGDYCGFTSLGTAVISADMTEAYDEMNTGRFQSGRHYRSQVWACRKATIYPYSAADTGQVEIIYRTASCGVDAGEIIRLYREMRGA